MNGIYLLSQRRSHILTITDQNKLYPFTVLINLPKFANHCHHNLKYTYSYRLAWPCPLNTSTGSKQFYITVWISLRLTLLNFAVVNSSP